MKYILLLNFLLAATLIQAQIGIRASYGSTDFPEWESFAFGGNNKSNESFLSPGMSIGVDYWFRLKKKRIEFMPELGYTLFSPSAVNNIDYNLSSVNAFFNIHVYPLDLSEDCNCPTFSKQGNTIKKGFFIHAAPMIKYFIQEANGLSKVNSTAIVPGFRAGAGLDIGINDWVTITPMISYEVTSLIKWMDLRYVTIDPLIDPVEILDIDSGHSGFYGSLRLGFSFEKR